MMFLNSGCSLLATRPVQEMSDTGVAIRAAKEVQADTLAAELYRSSTEWFFKAKNEYKYKNFKLARDYANRARRYAELAEFEAIRNGGNRGDTVVQDPMDKMPSEPKGVQSGPSDFASPSGKPAVDPIGNAVSDPMREPEQPNAPPTAPPSAPGTPPAGAPSP